MKINYFLVIFIIIFGLLGCSTLQKKDDRDKWDYEQYLLHSFKLTNGGRYQEAIDLLNEIMKKFPNESVVGTNYNIAFILYKMNKYDESISYCNTVINLYETGNFSEAMKVENKKYSTLATIIIEKIKTKNEDKKDPYHINEEIEANKKIKPQNDDGTKK